MFCVLLSLFKTTVLGLCLAAGVVGVLYILYKLSVPRTSTKDLLATAAPRSKYGVLIGLDSDVQGNIYEIKETGLILGRDSSRCHVVTENVSASREHAHLVPFEKDVIAFDMRSKNGTYVNGRRIVEAILQDGDHLALGKKKPTTFVFRR